MKEVALQAFFWWPDASYVTIYEEGGCYLWRLTKYFIHVAE